MKFSRDSVRTGGVGDLETTELDRRAADGVRHGGKVKEVDYKSNPPRYRAEFGDANDQDDYILTDWLPAGGGRAQGDVDTHFLEVGERVTMLSEHGEFATAQIVPAGTYTKDDGRKAGTQKAGVWIKQTANKQEHSFDRETGSYRLIAKGQKQQDQTSSTSTPGSGSSGSSTSTPGSGSASSGGGEEIKGDVHWEAADGTLDMKDGVFTIKFGSDSLVFKKGSFKVTIGGKTIELADMFKVVADTTIQGKTDTKGGDLTNEGKSVGSTHRHMGVMPGGGQTQGPV